MIKIDTAFGAGDGLDLASVASLAKRAEHIGFDALWSSETQHDPFLPLALAAEHTQRITLGTGIAVAFARSPTVLAHQAWDLQKLSNGRFVLGLGTQVKAHIERRFGMTWDRPAARLREYILAIRALWQCWQTGETLNFRGEFFKLTLMAPFFDPGPIEHPHIPIYIAGVNEQLCQLAGELCEGFHVHPFHTPKYLAEVILPNIEMGLNKSGRARGDIQLASSVFVIGGDTEAARHAKREAARKQIAFYASTPSYHPVFALHGWKTVAEELSALAARGRWEEMPALVTDAMLAEFAEEGEWAALPAKLLRRYDGLLDRLGYYFNLPDDVARMTVEKFGSFSSTMITTGPPATPNDSEPERRIQFDEIVAFVINCRPALLRQNARQVAHDLADRLDAIRAAMKWARGREELAPARARALYALVRFGHMNWSFFAELNIWCHELLAETANMPLDTRALALAAAEASDWNTEGEVRQDIYSRPAEALLATARATGDLTAQAFAHAVLTYGAFHSGQSNLVIEHALASRSLFAELGLADEALNTELGELFGRLDTFTDVQALKHIDMTLAHMRASHIVTAECILLFQRGQCLERMGDQIGSLVNYETLVQRAGAIGLTHYVEKGLYSLARRDIQRAQRAHERVVAEQQYENAPWDWQEDAFAEVLKRAQEDAVNN